MQRETLFRGKLSHSKQWVEGNLITARNGAKYIIPFEIFERDGHHLVIDSDEPYWVDSETVGQLWMRVENLKLFDGDVFDFPKYKVRFVVKYNEKRHQFCIAHPDELNLKYFNPWQCPDEKWIEEFMKDAVLVGNIHDNPELL